MPIAILANHWLDRARVAGFIILSFYSVIAGWAFAYVGKALQQGTSLARQPAQLGRNVCYISQVTLNSLLLWTTVVIVTTCAVVARGLKQRPGKHFALDDAGTCICC